MNFINSILKNPKSKTRKVVIAFLLLILWFCLTVWYIIIFDESVLVLSFNHGEENFTSISYNRLLEGEKLAGEFIAQDENLGIVSVRFRKLPRIPWDQEDILVFRIKEKGSEQWYYTGEYMSGLTFDVPFLPFGFPVIEDSKGKTYQFEIESLDGNSVNGVILSDRDPILVSKYQKSKEILFSNPQKLLDFGYKKFFYSFYTIDISYSSFIFALPLIFYLIWISPINRHVISPLSVSIAKKIKTLAKKLLGKHYEEAVFVLSTISSHWMASMLVASILIDILFLQVQNSLLYFSGIGLWLFLMHFRKKDSRVSIAIGLGLLLIAPIAYEFQNLNIAEKAAAWAFMFFVGGVTMAMIELKKSKRG